MPTYGQVQQNTLRVITQVVCPQGFSCPSPSSFTMQIEQANNPTPSSFPGSSSGVDVSLGDGRYLVNERVPNNPAGLVVFPTRSPSCVGSIGGGQTVTCTVVNEYLESRDDDGDGLLNGLETNGIPYTGNDGVLHHYILPGANPLHKNLYVEVDYMLLHRPFGGNNDFLSALGDVRKSFRNAPVSNPDGINGINLRTDLDEQIPHQDTTNMTDLVNNIKPKWFGTATERADPNHVNLLAAKGLAYHYAVFAHDQSAPGSGSSGIASTPGMNFLVTLGARGWPEDPVTRHPVGSRDQQAGTFMHELGHNLGLSHAGSITDPVNCKVNYFSVMNYLFQFSNYVASRPLDYSRSALATLDKNNLNEPDGISQSTPENLTAIYGPVGPGQGPGFTNAGRPVDWNFNERFDETGIASDINAGLNPPACGTPGPGQLLNGFNDWPALTYIFPAILPSQQQQQQQQLLISQQQISPVEHELSINDVRHSRLDLLEGIINALERVLSAPPSEKLAELKQLVFEIQNFKAALRSEQFSPQSLSPIATTIAPTPSTTTTATTTNIPTILSSVATLLQKPTGAGSIDTTHLAQLLKTDQVDAAIGELDNLLAQVITLSHSSHQSQQQQQLPEQQQQLPEQQQQQSNSRDNLP